MVVDISTAALPLISDGIRVVSNLGEGYPPLVFLVPGKGLISAVVLGPEDSEEGKLGWLRKQVRSLREDYESLKAIPHHVIAFPQGSLQQSLSEEIDTLPDGDFPISAVEEIFAELFPQIRFEASRRLIPGDEARADREEDRIALDAAQVSMATESTARLRIITGPAGSGKTLVLAARARLVAERNPDLNIQLLCFNRGLVPYLRSLVEDFPSVSVSTFASWAFQNGYSLNTRDCGASLRGLEKLRRSGIERRIDLLLVDEFQDFCAAWLLLLLDSLNLGQGEAVFAGDDQQALYRDPELEKVVDGESPEFLQLGQPYRSTRQILEIVGILDPVQSVPGSELAPSGEPVELVWTDAPLDSKAHASAHIVAQLRKRGFLLGDIAVLVTNKYMIGTIAAVLNSEGIKAEPRWANKIEPDDPAWSNSVKVTTIHSAKGLGHSAVVLVGLDDLKHPDSADNEQKRQELARFARLNLVGPTRAENLLFIIAGRDNEYMKRIKREASQLELHHWPEDYEG